MARELRRLFGEAVAYLASITEPEALELSADLLERVQGSADGLMRLRGDAAAQCRYVAGLPFEVRLTLCMWLRDSSMAARLIRATLAKAGG